MTRGTVGRVELAAGLCHRRLTAVRVLEARGREGGMVKIGWTCPPHRGGHESTGDHDKRWPPARPSEYVPCLHRRLRINRWTLATLVTLRTARRGHISSAEAHISFATSRHACGNARMNFEAHPWRLDAPLLVFYAAQRAPPPASNCSPVNQ